ncbi:transporter substrate-binding domain-containing protein [Thalassomonas viridans]|uniref:Transporter substrate-binding domain-containing protein n=1 Tax=Thalassomonas viridans TaxID=137584 RepID=A0AAE9Z1G8_9GAMM|nr:transporter substrate-binding domain-containing protein [Thalassomonas viridans]WDE04279.1 transporter substrate-binding domain-containing protein [Thalassomonas viridans]
MKLVLALLLVFLSGRIYAENPRLISVIEPPANYLNARGEPDGFVTDIIRTLQEELNNHSKIEFIPEARALKIAEQNANVILFSFSRTPEREQKFHWLGQVQSKKWHIITLKTRQLAIDSPGQLKTLPSIGVVRGDVREAWLIAQGFSNISSVASHEQNIRRLLTGRVTAILYELQGLRHLTASLRLEPDTFESVYIANQSDVYILMSKQGTSPTLLRRWQQAFSQLRHSGKLGQIARKWQARLLSKQNTPSEVVDNILVF